MTTTVAVAAFVLMAILGLVALALSGVPA